MKIEAFYDAGDELWAIFTKGHVSLDLFKAAAARALKENDVDERMQRNAALGHHYMLEVTAEDDFGEDFDSEHPWFWCGPNDAGAVPVTAYRFS